MAEEPSNWMLIRYSHHCASLSCYILSFRQTLFDMVRSSLKT